MKIKRLLGFLLGLTLVFALAVTFTACRDGGNEPDPTPTPDPELQEMTGVSFEGGEFVYDGTEKKIVIGGTLPEGASVSYEGNSATDAGTYTASVTVTCKGYKTYTASAPLIINKADITGVTLDSLNAIYDGTEKEITVSGTLPEGVSVEYTGNRATEVGTHPVSATVSGRNYNTLELNAFIIIEEAPTVPDQDILGVMLDGASFVYDGSEKSLAVSGTLPEGVKVEYAGNGKVDAGTYTVTAVLSGEGYRTLTLTAEMKITKATLTGITLSDATFTYAEGVYRSLEIRGTLPEGVTVEYTGNEKCEAGTYTVTAVISGDNYETLVLEATLHIRSSGFITPIQPF